MPTTNQPELCFDCNKPTLRRNEHNVPECPKCERKWQSLAKKKVRK